jgi:hypothetical protein
MQSGLKSAFSAILAPTLIKNGFQRVQLKGCIHYEELWRNDRIWFGVSYDIRDQYLEINLGHLYWFRDVMPRVVILGHYGSYVHFNPDAKLSKEGLSKTLESVRDTFESSITVYRIRYNEILQAKLHPKKAKYVKEYSLALGQEVKEEELKPFISVDSTSK